jgi:serine/threonine protein phosphatase 1
MQEFTFLSNKVVKIDNGQRCFFVGDIHGCYDDLMKKLSLLHFDFKKDVLISVGDLIDRGPDSINCLKLIDEPWFHCVYSNHEDFLLRYALNKMSDDEAFEWVKDNGGMWFALLSEDERDKLCQYAIARLKNVPITLEVQLPNGKRIGVVHAGLPVNDWDQSQAYLEKFPNRARFHMIWDRDRAESVIDYHIGKKSSHLPMFVQGIDAVVMGHNRVVESLHYGNCAWIDTVAYSGLTVIKAESILSRVRDINLEGPNFK